tara:strand:- start:2243 stop:3052 length:810 start_codon:yes stop_codon:yes gene_type:complete
LLVTISHNNQNYNVNTRDFFDISIPMNFNNKQPNFYDVKKSQLKYLNHDGKIFSVAKGAGCNVPEINLNIHCSGTHTECVGHLLEDSGNIGKILNDLLLPAILITVKPFPFSKNNESYHYKVGDNEQVLSKKTIENEINKWKFFSPKAIVVRTTPNIEEKKYFKYSQNLAPFFTNEALKFFYEIGIEHLVVDIPSIDRMVDGKILGNHRIFWGDGFNSRGKINPKSKKTITELTYIPNSIKDGCYFLNIQIPHFVCDAAPSRPLLLKID